MNHINTGIQFLALLLLAWPTGAFAQQVSPAAGNALVSGTPAAAAQVPRLIKFSGAVRDAGGKPVSSMTGITFALYQDQEGGTPLWIENQNVQPDAAGRYTVWLGATKNDGMPVELFASGQARWLGVQVEGQPEQARVLLAAVPYAMKAADAETVGGLPPSAFLLAGVSAAGVHAMDSNPRLESAAGVTPAVGGLGTKNYVPFWIDSSGDLGNSVMYQNGSNIGVGTTAAAISMDIRPTSTSPFAQLGVAQTVDYMTLFASDTYGPAFYWDPTKALRFGKGGTGLYSATSFVEYMRIQPNGNVGIGTQTPAATLEVNGNAQVDGNLTLKGLTTFGAGQTFPGTGTVTSVTAGTGLTASPNPITSSGSLSIDTTKVPQLNAANVFNANQTVNGQVISTVTTGTAPLVVSSTTQVANLNASYLDGLNAGNFQPAGTIPLPFNGTASSAGTLFTLTNTAAGANGMAAYGAQAAVNSRFSGTGVLGYGGATNSTPSGLMFEVGAGTGVYGLGGTGVAPTNGYTVVGGIGVEGQGGTGYSDGGTGVFAVGGTGTNSTGGTGIVADGGSGPGGTGNAGFFGGNVDVTGSLSKSGGSFKIDHPLDPANKYLYHSFVESPDMKNIYDGTVVTDGSGTAVVTMPTWFEALNTDFRYQLTVIGQFAQAIIASEMTNSSFTIKTDKPNVKVSWQVTGIRQDAWAKAHRIQVEVDKAPKEQGHYIHPELYGHAGEPGIAEVLHPRLRKP